MATTTSKITNAQAQRTLCKFIASQAEEFKAFCAQEGYSAQEVASKAAKHLETLEKSSKGGAPTKEQIQNRNDATAIVRAWRESGEGTKLCKELANLATENGWCSIAVVSPQKMRSLLKIAIDAGDVVRTCDETGTFWFGLSE